MEFFADTERADLSAEPIEAVHALVVPVVTVYEVVKKPSREAGEGDAALHGLRLADSLIYATARIAAATLWTQDARFDGLPGVRYLPKSRVRTS